MNYGIMDTMTPAHNRNDIERFWQTVTRQMEDINRRKLQGGARLVVRAGDPS